MRSPPTPEQLKEQQRAQRERYIARHGREKLRAAGRKYYRKTREELRRLRAEAGRT
jgi:hypothetical protein